MSAVPKLLIALVALALAAGAVALGIDALTAADDREVVTLPSGSAGATPTPAATPERRDVDDDDRPLWPDEERRASSAALRVTGGGEVVELDRSDDPGEAYEVEVIKDGREYDVALDLDFEPVRNRRYDD